MDPSYEFNEELSLKPLPDRKVIAHFHFESRAPPPSNSYGHHHHLFPKSIYQLVQKFRVKEMELSFTQGRWNHEKWGGFDPLSSMNAKPVGVELWAEFEGPLSQVGACWKNLNNALSGILCASINFLESSASYASPSWGFGPNSNKLRYETAAVEVNRGLLKELEDMGFSMARAAWALHHSGNSSLETAVNWIVDHENDSQFDTMPLVEFNIEIESPNPHDDTAETAQARANELKERARKLKEEEENKREREREKERIRAGKEMMETKRIAEENERKRNIALREAEKGDDKKAREKIMQKVNADKAERRSRLGLPRESESTSTSAPPDTRRILMPSQIPASKAEEMRECLRSLRRNHKDEGPRMMRKAFETLLMIVRNAAKNPDEEKYRRIRITNRLFQERVGRFKEGIEFMELCGFKREEGSEFLSLSNHDADISRLRDAAFLLQSAITNPFFGLLSKEAQSS